MTKEEASMIGFEIVAYSGDARSKLLLAVENAKPGNFDNGEFDEADELIKKGESELTKAHNAQTELLAKEAQGKNIEYSIMLVHAQDHLMTTLLLKDIISTLIDVYKK
mgnify:CR=1 FL=1